MSVLGAEKDTTHLHLEEQAPEDVFGCTSGLFCLCNLLCVRMRNQNRERVVEETH